VNPIYFDYPYQDNDDVTIQLPSDWQVENVSKPQHIEFKVCLYRSQAEKQDASVHLTRQLGFSGVLRDATYYAALRNFYQQVRTGDEQQIILTRSGPTAQN